MPNPTGLRLGVQLDSDHPPAWIASTLARIVEADFAEIALLLLTPSSPDRTESAPHSLYSIFDRRLFKSHPDLLAPTDASPLLKGIPSVSFSPLHPERPKTIHDDIFAEICTHRLDLILHFSATPLTEALCATARFGLWTTDLTTDPNPGYQEVLSDSPITTFSLYAYSPPATKRLLCTSHIATDRASVHRNRARLCRRAETCILRRLTRLHSLGEEVFLSSLPQTDLTASPPSATASTLSTFLRRRLQVGLRNLYSRNQWTLMLGRGDPLSTDFAEFEHIIPPKGSSWADPFLLYRDDKHYLFIEEVPRNAKKGRISLIEFDQDLTPSAPLVLIERSYHLSYPFLFDYEDALYMIPESNENGTIELYRCDEFPHRWSFHMNLMTGVRAADTTLVRHGEKWWLFTCMAAHPGSNTREELFLFHADSPLTTHWTPHPLNPILSDARRARPAGGIFTREDALFRPSQDGSVRYGYALRLNRIIELNEREYREDEVRCIEPDWHPSLIATHTLNHAHGLTIIDAKLTRKRWQRH